ncbi:DUF6454 family protein [Nocardioides sp.]|uniref:DUF6454 family protein n=1 Tax=Nocardioides sp. TaxID=35761 RepID=UPI003565DB48
MPRPTLRSSVALASLALLTATGVAAHATGSLDATERPGHRAGHGGGHDGQLAGAFRSVDRSSVWSEVERLELDFPTFHTEGLVVTEDRLFLSSVEVVVPPVKYPSPVGGHDRTPGAGVGHLFVMDREGNLERDIVLGEGDMYHPGGISTDGKSIWVPVAEYRPDSASIVYRVDPETLEVTEQFRVPDHIGGVVRDATSGRLVGNTWGSREFQEWDLRGRQRDAWSNPSHFVDYQDCQYADSARMICAGITNLPQRPGAGGPGASYELGGLALIDLRTHEVLHEVPFQRWSTAGHVMTRNPVKLSVEGGRLTLRAAPDDGDEANGTEVYTFTMPLP